MTNYFEEFLSVLDIKSLGNDVYEGESTHKSWQRIFGGQVIGQSVIAAQKSVDPKLFIHSLHCYFIRPGDQSIPIRLEVERMRDGRSFATRRVVAKQNDQNIFALSASFHIKEEGFNHQLPMPEAPDPDALPTEMESAKEYLDNIPPNVVENWVKERPIDMRFSDHSQYFNTKWLSNENRIWFKLKQKVDVDEPMHQAMLAYISDYTLLGTALLPHGTRFYLREIMGASLDHSIWFHRPFRVDDWLLYHMETPSASGGRGFCRGSIFDKEGRLVASVAQEGLIRPMDPAKRKN